MKAAVFREYHKDPTKVVKIEDIDVPKIKPNEVLIKVESSAYNYNDLWAIWGDPVKTPLPHISGSDVAGSVVEVGEDVTKFKVGDRVVSHSNMSCRICELCTSGREYDCKDRLIWGFQTGPLWGGFAQYTHLPEVNVAKLPENVSFDDAAAMSMVGMTAWHMLVGRAKIKPGQTVLIMGGTSGVGMVGIQISKLYNCNVIATAGNQQKMDKCLELGADNVVNHREQDWYKKVREMTKKEGGVDIVFEHIGKNVFPQEVSLLKMGGTLVATGATTGYDSTIDLRYLFFKGTNLLGSTQGTKAELEQVIYWTNKGKLKPLIHTSLPFSNMVEGHVMMAGAEQIGKIVTSPQKL
jgi:alcohol dehydrogenase